ncbi:CotH kinase family protein, partial [bacterium]|nr:CotH kinase family protein [bacterium]
MNWKRYILCLAFILICASGLRADWPPDYDLAEPVYRDTSLAVVTVTMDPDSLAWLLEWDNRWNYRYLPADMIFQNSVIAETLYNVGIRLRGNTSRSSAKKSFKLKPDAFESGQKLSG